MSDGKPVTAATVRSRLILNANAEGLPPTAENLLAVACQIIARLGNGDTLRSPDGRSAPRDGGEL